MNYEEIRVVRDKEHRCSFVTLPGGKIVCITDSGDKKEVEKLPATDPPFTPTREKKVFEIEPYPRTGLEVPSFLAETIIQKMYREALEEQPRK